MSTNLCALREAFLVFRDECIWLQTCHNTFQALFPEDGSTDQTLRGTASQFFAELNTVYVEYWVLLVCRLTDRERRNLTVSNLTTSLNDLGLLTSELRTLEKSLLGYRKVVNDARHRLVAHADKKSLLAAAVLSKHTAAAVAGFVRDLQSFNDLVAAAIGEKPLDYSCTACDGDVHDLLRALRSSSSFPHVPAVQGSRSPSVLKLGR